MVGEIWVPSYPKYAYSYSHGDPDIWLEIPILTNLWQFRGDPFDFFEKKSSPYVILVVDAEKHV